jgi:DNA helicase-2/ATP-dependent DNA helicase PcrA
MVDALPAGVATEDDLTRLRVYLSFVRRLFTMRTLAPDDLAVTLSNALFSYPQEEDGARDGDLSIAHQIASMIRRWRDLQPGWRLPEIVAQLDDVATGKRPLPVVTPQDVGFEPAPGRVTLTTQHSAKGLEWDAVFLVGIDGFWIPDDLQAPFLGVHDFLGGDPAAESTAQLRQLMDGSAGLYEGRTPTETAHIEVIGERLRLLYVGITRARRYLHISRSRVTRYYQRERETEATQALGVIHDALKEKSDGDGAQDF